MRLTALILLGLLPARLLPAGTQSGLFLNELLANTPQSWLELANQSEQSAELSGCELRIIQPTASQTWTFGPDTELGPGSFLILPRAETGLQFPATGGRVELRSPTGEVIDALDYGPQLPAESIGRIGNQWALLTAPSPGNENGPAAPLGDLTAVRLNEWRLNSASQPGWVELFNPNQSPVDLAGSQLSDRILDAEPFYFPHLSFLEPLGWHAFRAAPEEPRSRWNTGFNLASSPGPLRLLLQATGESVDSVELPTTNRLSAWGRLPDGGAFVAPLSLPTPGAMNQSEFDSDGDVMGDGWEVRFGLNPLNPADAQDDPDADGLTNLDEYRAGRNPVVNDPPIPVAAEVLGDGRFRLRFAAELNTSYSILAGDSPDAVNELFVPFIADGAARQVEILDDLRVGRYFRVVTPARAQ